MNVLVVAQSALQGVGRFADCRRVLVARGVGFFGAGAFAMDDVEAAVEYLLAGAGVNVAVSDPMKRRQCGAGFRYSVMRMTLAISWLGAGICSSWGRR